MTKYDRCRKFKCKHVDYLLVNGKFELMCVKQRTIALLFLNQAEFLNQKTNINEIYNLLDDYPEDCPYHLEHTIMKD
jgi:hypothetical protein